MKSCVPYEYEKAHTVRRSVLRHWTLLILVALVMTFTGCIQTSSGKTVTTQPTMSSEQQVTTQPSSKPSSTQQTGITTIPTTNNNELTIEDKIAAAPAIEGAEKTIRIIGSLQRVIYLALPENPYNLEAGVILGEYKHEVFLGEEQTGGLALAAPAAQAYLEAALAAMPLQQARWLLTLPLDITDCQSLQPVKIDLSAKPFIDRPYYIRISTADEQVGVVNILDAQHQVVIDAFNVFDLHYVISERSLNSTRIIEGEEMAFLFVIVNFLNEPQSDAAYTYGDRVGTTTEPVLAGLTSVRGPMQVHDYDCILKIDGCPVFLMANRQN